jgi:hypothetical protein
MMNTLQLYKAAQDVVGKVNKVAADLASDLIAKDPARELIKAHLQEALDKFDE